MSQLCGELRDNFHDLEARFEELKEANKDSLELLGKEVQENHNLKEKLGETERQLVKAEDGLAAARLE